MACLHNGQLIQFEHLLLPAKLNLSEKHLKKRGPAYWLNAMTTEEIDMLLNAVRMERMSELKVEEYCGGMYMTHTFLFSDRI